MEAITKSEQFDDVANELLNNYVIVAGGTHFNIIEIEFYLHNE